MAVALDILRAWRHPRRVMARHLDAGRREDRALIFLMLGAFLMFLAQWPRLVRLAALEPGTPLDARLGGALLGWLFIVPLAFYALAAVSRLLARVFGGRGNAYGARLALFWALLASAPAWLLYGVLVGLVGPGGPVRAVGALALGGFFVIWLASLFESETGGAPQP